MAVSDRRTVTRVSCDRVRQVACDEGQVWPCHGVLCLHVPLALTLGQNKERLEWVGDGYRTRLPSPSSGLLSNGCITYRRSAPEMFDVLSGGLCPHASRVRNHTLLDLELAEKKREKNTTHKTCMINK